MKNKLLKKVMLPCLFLIGSIVYAQTVSGVVSDASGPIPGVNVLVKGTTTGTQTDFDGNYSVNVSSADAVLVFSFLGYASQEIPVNGQTTINVTLQEDIAQLNEVVVVGYGSTTKKEITSSVTKVSEEDFNQGTINSPSELLQGKVAGLSIYNKGGNPNEDAVIRLRGISTVGANQSPLIVIDGVIGASLGNIDPSDIEMSQPNPTINFNLKINPFRFKLFYFLIKFFDPKPNGYIIANYNLITFRMQTYQ
jgi:iron complex outermembrane receptor protein